MDNQFEFLNYLLAENFLNKEQLQHCLAWRAHSEQNLSEILQEQAGLSEAAWQEAVGHFWGLPYKAIAPDEADPKFLRLIPGKWLLAHNLVPCGLQGGQLLVAVASAPSAELANDLAMMTGREILFALAEAEQITAAIWAMLFKAQMTDGDNERNGRQIFAIDAVDFDDANIAKTIVNSLLQKALAQKASDIHLELFAEVFVVKLRIDGFLHPLWRLPKQLHGQIINRLKIMAQLDITEKRIPQDGHIRISYRQVESDLRVSTLPLIYGEKLVLRLLDSNHVLGRLSDLNFSADNLQLLRQVAARPYGLILVCGPTGSGKTTTLYGLLNQLKGQGRNIVTIEDPVEYEISGINQLQVNEKVGMTFAKGLRGILRQDPDIMMVGEIRDGETAEIAIKAALTGHLVLGSLHTNDAISAVTRLMDMGIAPYLVAGCIQGVVAQRLVRRNCPHCLVADGQDVAEAKRGTGCSLCHNLGYDGRLPLQEVWLPDEGERALIGAKAEVGRIRQAATVRGFQPISVDGLAKVRQGLTTLEEVAVATKGH